MMGSISWKKYKDTAVLVCDYKNLESAEIIALFQVANQKIIKSDKRVRVLSDFSGCRVDKYVTSYLKNAESKIATENMKKSAVLGIAGLKKAALNFYNAATGGHAKAFTNARDALNWLTEM
jgi:5S rRNA maturation endonuclease (ribonuclease M5)